MRRIRSQERRRVLQWRGGRGEGSKGRYLALQSKGNRKELRGNKGTSCVCLCLKYSVSNSHTFLGPKKKGVLTVEVQGGGEPAREIDALISGKVTQCTKIPLPRTLRSEESELQGRTDKC